MRGRDRQSSYVLIALIGALAWGVPFELRATVDGEPHRLLRQYRVFGAAAVTGNTLMTASIAAPEVNSGLLPRSAGDVTQMPFDAELVAAHLFWTGSIDTLPDQTADFTAADGAFFNDVPAERCVTVPSLGGFFYCRADVTDRLRGHGGADNYNGTYFVGDVEAEPGYLDMNGQCLEPAECQAKYAGWSLVIVYEASSVRTLRDVFIYDGFRQLDETPETPGVDSFDIRGFSMPRNGRASLTFIGLEGDAFLGVPPQDTDPVFPCATCYDFLEFNGTKLSNAINPPNNLFNSSSPGGYTLGLDIDTFDVSGLLAEGQSQARVRVGSGDGISDINNPDPAGGGESFFLGFVMLNVDRNAPNFRRDGTLLTVVPDAAAPLERVVVQLDISNEGTLDSPATRVRLELPAGLTYLPGSFQVDGEARLPGQAINPLSGLGYNLGNIPFQGDNSRRVGIRATIDAGVVAGTRFDLQGQLTSASLEVPSPTNVATLVVLGGVDVGRPTKSVSDDTFQPGELVRYDIAVPNPNDRAVNGARIEDVLPPYLDIVEVIAFSGVDRSRRDENWVIVDDVSIPPGAVDPPTLVSIFAQLHDAEQLIADGVAPGSINGFRVGNQGAVTVAGDRQLTDDASTAQVGDPTRFTISSAVDITGPGTRKTGRDVNGGQLEPGDTVEYAIRVENTGSSLADVSIEDVLPPSTGACERISVHPGIACVGARLQGSFVVAAGRSETVVFRVRVDADAADGIEIANVATVRVVQAADQTVVVRSAPLRVVSAPVLDTSEKVLLDGAQGGVTVPGEWLTYGIAVRNTGNRAATDVVVIDPLAFRFDEVSPGPGGVYDFDANAITWILDPIEPGAERLVTFDAVLPPAIEDGTRIVNRARIGAAELAEPLVTNRVAVRVESGPLLAVRKRVQPREGIGPGDTVTYTITVENVGTDVARDVVIRDPLPVASFAEVEVGLGRRDGDTVIWDSAAVPALGSVAVGASASVVVSATLLPVLGDGHQIDNRAFARAQNGADEAASDDPDTPASGDATTFRVEAAAEIALLKSVEDLNGGDVQPGDRLIYTIRVDNRGNAPSPGLPVADTLPPREQLVDVEYPVGRPFNGRIIDLSFDEPLMPGVPREFQFAARVAPVLPAGTRIDNQARVRLPSGQSRLSDDPTTPAPDDPTSVIVVSRPDLSTSIKRVVPAGEVRPGDVVEYTIEVVNSGTAPAVDVRLADRIPAELDDVFADDAVVDGGIARWAIAALDAGERATFTLRGRVRAGLADRTLISNQAVASAVDLDAELTDDPTTPEPDDATVVTVRAQPILTFDKTVLDQNGEVVRPGDRLEYTLTVTNVGDAVAGAVEVRDPMPDDLEIEAIDADGRVVDGIVLFTGPDLAPGETYVRTIIARVVSPLANGTSIVNQATVAAGGVDEPVDSDDPRTAEPADPTAVQVVSAADLSASTKRRVAPQGIVRPGDRVEYRIEVTNTGDDAATNVVVRDAIPEVLLDAVAEGGRIDGADAVWRIAGLAPGQTERFVLSATVRSPLADGTTVRNQGQISADGVADPFLTDDPDTPEIGDPTVFTVTAEAVLSVVKIAAPDAGFPVRPGGALSYTLAVANTGDAAADDVELIDDLDERLIIESVPEPAFVEGRRLRWPIGTVSPGSAPAVLTVRVRVPPEMPDGTRIANQAFVGELGSDDPSTEVVGDPTAFLVQDRADLSTTTKSVVAEDGFRPGGIVTYEIAVQNTGTQRAHNVVVRDDFPAGLTLLATVPPGRVEDGEIVSWRIDALDAGARTLLSIRARIDNDVLDETLIANQATIAADALPEVLSDDPTTEALDDPTGFAVVARPVLVLEKSVRDDTGDDFAPGDPITYTLTLRNVGSDVARDVVVIDPYDERLEGIVAVGGDVEGGVARWRAPVIPVGAEVVYEMRGRIAANVPDGTEISNAYGAVIGGLGRPQESETVTFTVRFGRLAGSEKTVEPLSADGFSPGAPVRYRIVLHNDGESAVRGVSVADLVDVRSLTGIRVEDGGFFNPDRGLIEWSPERTRALAEIGPGARVELVFDARIREELRPGDVVANQGLVLARGDPAPVVTDDPSTDEPDDATIFEVEGGPRIEVEKSIVGRGGAIRPGDSVSYEIRVENRGFAPSEAPVLTDLLPPEVEYVPGTTLLDGRLVPDVAGRARVEFGLPLFDADRPVLGPGEAVRVQLQVRVRDDAPIGQVVPNQGTVQDAIGNVEPSDDPDTPVDDDPTTFVVGGVPDVSTFTKTWRADTADGRVRVGDEIEWALTIVNRGSADAVVVQIIDPIPDRAEYVRGSLVLDEASLSDREDADSGEVIGGQVQVRLGTLPAGRVREVRFRTTAIAGPTIANQARAELDDAPPEPSDDDGDEANGDGPTVVPVGDAPVRRLRVDMAVSDPTGPPAIVGEMLTYTIGVFNDGNVALDGVEIDDPLPAGLLFEDAPLLPDGVEVEFEAPPAGNGGGRLRFTGLRIAEEDGVNLQMILRIDPAIEDDRRICNSAEGRAEGVAPVESRSVCVDAEVQFGAVAGAVFQDVDDDGAPGGDVDIAFAGMRVAASDGADPDAPPIEEVETDDGGRFRLESLRPGRYRLRVFSATGVLLRQVDDVAITADRTQNLDVAIDPSGRVYDSVEGTLLDGAEVFIYRDEDDTNDDVTDLRSQRLRVLAPPEELEAASQQGQRTAHGGLYRFAVRRAGRYFIEVVPPGVVYSSPSVLVPAERGVAVVGDPEGRVVPNDLPSVEPDVDRTWFQSFQLDSPDDIVVNNHVPLDPLSSLIDFQKHALDPDATTGEVVTFQIDMANGSERDLVYESRDSGTSSGGVFVQDVIPKGFKYVAGSAVLSRLEGGREIPLLADDPSGARILRFGRLERTAEGLVLRPFDLRAGERLRLRYQLVVGADAKPNRVYTNRAVLLADGTVPVSRVASAEIRVRPDPIFDQGLLLGKVWCDDDGDGWQDEDERGFSGARVYMDHGWFAETDAAGKFHFKDLDPGLHAVKIDVDTLLPGAELTTDEMRVVHFTRGLPAKIDFGVTCPTETADAPVLELDEAGWGAALGALARDYAVVTGDVDALSVRVGDATATTRPVTIELTVDGRPVGPEPLVPNGDGVEGKLAFAVGVPPSEPILRWRVRIGPVGGNEVTAASGIGAPPRHIAWDQRSVDGDPVLRDGVFGLRLEFDSGYNRYGSPVRAVRVGEGTIGVGEASGGGELLGTLRGPLFDDSDNPTPRLRQSLRGVGEKVIARDGLVIRIEAYGAGQLDDAEEKAQTERRAQAAARVLAEMTERPAERFRAVGVGNDRPLVPNLSRANRRENRRLEIYAEPADTAAKTPAGPSLTDDGSIRYRPFIRVGRQDLAPDASGQFATTARIGDDGYVEIALRATDGRIATLVLEVAEPDPGVDAGQPRRSVDLEGTLPDGLTLAGVQVTVPEVSAEVSHRDAEGHLFALTTTGELAAWRFAVQAPDGQVAHAESGSGRPPPEVTWAPPAMVLPGTYRYRLTIRTHNDVIAQSTDGSLELGRRFGRPRAQTPQMTVRVDGKEIPPQPNGRVFARLDLARGAAPLLDITRADGSRVVFMASVPPEEQELLPATTEPEAAPATEVPPSLVPARGDVPQAEPSTPPGDDLLDPWTLDLKPLEGMAGDPPPNADAMLDLELLPDPTGGNEVRDFGRAELARFLGGLGATAGIDAHVAARQLEVDLPPKGSELAHPAVSVRGRTAPGNRVLANGVELAVDAEGMFAGQATLPVGPSELVIEALDPQGNRGVIRWPLVVREHQWFVLAFGEGLSGFVGSELDGVQDHTSVNVNDSVYLHGRAVAYFKGRIRGEALLGGLFDEYGATAHLDTARRREFEGYFEQLVDPEAWYPVYGDSAKEIRDVNTRGPLYVLIEADASRLTVGNFKTGLDGLELFRYDRTLYGAHADLDVKVGDESKFRHEVTAFVADDDAPERHAYVELRGTGGSLYYLPHERLVEGSERLYLIERDRISGIERRRVPLARDADYTIRYTEGRILAKSPVPSVGVDGFGPLPQPARGEVLDGHPVFLGIEYDHRDRTELGDTASGVHLRETWNDRVTVGAGYVEEGRADRALPTYKLWGADLGLRTGRRTHATFEIARSQSQNGENLFSGDGGLTFEPFNLRDGTEARGTSFQLRGGFELDDLLTKPEGEAPRDRWYNEAYWQYLAPGFYSGGSIQQQGLEKYGALTRWHIDEYSALRLQHDGVTSDAPATQGDAVFKAFRREVTRAGYTLTDGRLVFDTEFVHTQSDEGAEAGEPFVLDAFTLGADYQLDTQWKLLGEQEIVVRGDERIHASTGDLLTTTAGIQYRPVQEVAIEARESVRWSGDNATQIGVQTQIDDRHTAYVQGRFANRQGRDTATAVVGGEERLGGGDQSGRAYGEYQLETASEAARNRAVLGVAKRARIAKGLAIDAAYERSQVVGDPNGAEFSRDTISAGAEWLKSDRYKLTGRSELRFDDNDEEAGARDRVQFTASGGFDIKLTPDLSMLTRIYYGQTMDLEFDATEAEIVEASLGLAIRPVRVNWVAVLLKYTKRFEQRPIDVILEEPVREESDVIAAISIFELPARFQLVEKLAYKRLATRVDLIPTVVSHSLLLINRLNFHLTNTWDVGAEYRFLRVNLAHNIQHGAMAELNYIIQKRIRLGVGYNFTSFSDDEFARLDEDHGGPFFRVVGQY